MSVHMMLDKMPPERVGLFLDDERVATAQRLDAFARANDRTLLELAMSYLAGQPEIASVIAGATSPWRLFSSGL